MAENWCSEHNVAFFKKGGMRGYAHPVENPDGTTSWCNKPKVEEALEQVAAQVAKLPKGSVDMSAMEKSAKEGRRYESPIAPQERGMWYKELGEMLRKPDISKTDPHYKLLREAYYFEMFRVLGFEFGSSDKD